MKAWITHDTGFADIELPRGTCVLIAEDQRTFWPQAIRIIYKGYAVLVWPDSLTLDPQEIYAEAQ